MTFPSRRKNDEAHMKKIMKEAIKEWMDERFAAFGKWTATGLAVVTLSVLVWAVVQMNGVPWSK